MQVLEDRISGLQEKEASLVAQQEILDQELLTIQDRMVTL